MSLCRGLLCLLVLLGVAVTSGSPVHFVTYNLTEIHRSIRDPLGLTRPEIGNSPLFDFVLKSLNTSSQEDVMSATLDVYMRIFTSILHEKTKTSALLGQMSSTDEEKVEKDLKELHQKMKDLKRHLSHMIQNKKDVLNKLNTIKVEDPLIQRQALAQFLEVYQAASMVLSRSRGNTH